MPPGLVGSELSATPSQYLKSTMDESLFPPISRKSAISLGSETDPNDYVNSSRKSQTRGSVPASLASTPLKFPTIDRANSTSIASLPGSRSTRHRSMTRELRSSYCRSPSCPSNLNIRRDFNNVDTNIFNRYENANESDSNESTYREEKANVLPSIFSKDSSPRVDKSSRRDKKKDRTNSLSIRRTESFMHQTHQVGEQSLPNTGREIEQRQGQATALLLPIRNTTQTNKKKKKRRGRVSSESETDTPRNNDSENNTSRICYNRKSEDALDVIARENELYDDDLDTPRAIEISSSRKMKQWISNSKHSRSESEIKA
ncbi:uncharacterized protein LOC132732734 [Ruditapes philippinarum]|uniref:uncharacterized protein LOC132732734 n=1 Tax=Ruditapes philippinarum TaxID=129788 RepID=UPI00295BAEF3|nr:uncharacterized protein LOC132732734 [Ruditapes philippinarum]XP_060575203.1 uncharacterized protein LOC132732734 [Ruditapes philippinarum]XP_060575204.1 uncharacterized protein LOC132732734 [Ruditapes philippinarum]